MPIMLAMIPSPSTTRTTIAPKLRISNSATNRLSMWHHQHPCHQPPAAFGCLHLLPVSGLLEGMRRAIDGHFIEMPADQHQADRKSVHHAAGHRHRRVVRDIERRGVADHLERARAYLFPAGARCG